MNINSYCPVKIVSGKGVVRSNSAHVEKLGKRCLIVTSKHAAKVSGALDDFLNSIKELSIEYTIFDEITANPESEDCFRAGQTAKQFGADFIVGIGGGSALDASKAVAIYAKNDMTRDEIYSSSGFSSLPLVLIGTTCGTGSEVTGVSVLTNSSDGRKKSLHGENCYATISYCDYSYSFYQNPKTKLSTVLDAFCHALESFMSVKSNDLSEIYARRALKDIYGYLKSINCSDDTAGMSDETLKMLYVDSIYAGLAINITGTCAPHTLGYFLSENYNIPHGMACAVFETDFVKRCSASDRFARLMSLLGCDYDEFDRVLSRLTSLDLIIDKQVIESEQARWSGRINSFLSCPVEFTDRDAVDTYIKLFSK